ncbi:50S ribosomal protein L1 [Candidatus Dojkabacteria bacterium]|jgi:large subunit ribosomal protein L1|nr:50S ribosomal protein L1 [Candidatus Dojkabacteria bacterium]
MAKRGKKYVDIIKKKVVKEYSLLDGIKEVKKLSYSKFEGTLELHVAVTLPKEKDAKAIKGSISLPNASAKKTVRVTVFTNEAMVKKALAAGADTAGLEDLIKEVQGGKINFDIAIATGDVMAKMAVLGKELGPKGLMPNPKTGTVATEANLEETIASYKKGKQTFAADEQGGIHMNVGKLSLEDARLKENIDAAISAIEEVIGKPYNQVFRKVTIAPTMGPSVKVRYEK